MTQEFRKNINVPGTAFLNKVHIAGKLTESITYVDTDESDATIAEYTIGETENIIAVVSKATGSKTITLPDAQQNEGRMIWIFDAAAHANTVAIDIEYDTVSTSIGTANGVRLLLATKFFNGTTFIYKWVVLIVIGSYTDLS